MPISMLLQALQPVQTKSLQHSSVQQIILSFVRKYIERYAQRSNNAELFDMTAQGAEAENNEHPYILVYIERQIKSPKCHQQLLKDR